MMKRCFVLLIVVSLACGRFVAWGLDLVLPTANSGLLTGQPYDFYMHVNRFVGGVQTAAWEGGQYGFVRNPHPTPKGILYTRFHEGIDIRPAVRDSKGEPLDEIHAIADGRVVHTNPTAGASNFGRYLVIEHEWDGCRYYSLYAHLSDIFVVPGIMVGRGDKIARMGYTGRGIDRDRAHLHLEIALLLNENFDSAGGQQGGGGYSRHGMYNGMNLIGLDVAGLYIESFLNPHLTIPEFLAKEEVFFHVDLPGNYSVDLLKRYPWMETGAPPPDTAQPGGWRIYFAQSGIPLRVMRLRETVQTIVVRIERASKQPLVHLTNGLVSGACGSAKLTSRGRELISRLTYHSQAIASESGALAPPSTQGEKMHTVSKGETLQAIAKKYKVAVGELRRANKIKGTKLIQVGQVLIVPAPR